MTCSHVCRRTVNVSSFDSKIGEQRCDETRMLHGKRRKDSAAFLTREKQFFVSTFRRLHDRKSPWGSRMSSQGTFLGGRQFDVQRRLNRDVIDLCKHLPLFEHRRFLKFLMFTFASKKNSAISSVSSISVRPGVAVRPTTCVFNRSGVESPPCRSVRRLCGLRPPQSNRYVRRACQRHARLFRRME